MTREAWLRRVAALVFLSGIVFAFVTFAEKVRHENTLIFRFDPDLSARVRRLTASWIPVGELEATGGVILNFPGGPGREVRQVVSVPDGEYMISIEVEPRSLVETSHARRVTLTGSEIVIPITTRGFE